MQKRERGKWTASNGMTQRRCLQSSRKSAAFLWGYLCPKTTPVTPTVLNVPENNISLSADDTYPIVARGEDLPDAAQGKEIFTGYTSDQTDDDDGNHADSEDNGGNLDHDESAIGYTSHVAERIPNDANTPITRADTDPTQEISSFGIMERKRRCAIVEDTIPQLKRRKHEIPVRTHRQGQKNERLCVRTDALQKLEKMLNAKRCPFEGGHNGLQARRARAICGYLHMLVRNDRQRIDASERAAEAQGFAAKWGGRQVRAWAETWTNRGELPVSQKGRHVKIFTLLSDPEIRAELRSYVRSNKWAIDPAKLADFTAQKMVPTVAKTYGTDLMKNEVPKGLKRYLELELFPRIHMKVARGVSLCTARRWLHREGFRFTEHRKSLYFDGHERPDVVEYRQNIFIPQMKEHCRRIVEYVVGDVVKEKEKLAENYIERRLVLVSHDESTTQANDGKKKSWVHENEHALKKKGVGRGIHQSDVICSTVGWLKAASQSLEYGKNYEGYWNGELFVKQVS